MMIPFITGVRAGDECARSDIDPVLCGVLADNPREVVENRVVRVQIPVGVGIES
jgi:hypothetical protein